MTKRRRFQFGVKSILAVCALVAYALYFLRTSPYFIDMRIETWASRRSAPTPAHAKGLSAVIGVKRFSHALTGTCWDRPIRVFFSVEGSTAEAKVAAKSGPGVQRHSLRYLGPDWNDWQVCMDFTSQWDWLYWDADGGDPDVVMEEFASKCPVKQWTREGFVEWIAAREERAK